VCLISSTPSVLTASPKTKWSSWQELLGDAKAAPARSRWARRSAPPATSSRLIEKAAGIKFKYVSYEGWRRG
jgi:tripartite-type tricarboxylate transporter receptor subunit TctC